MFGVPKYSLVRIRIKRYCISWLNHHLVLFCVVVMLCGQLACRSQSDLPGSIRSGEGFISPPALEYRFGPSDVVEILVWKNPDLSREVMVRPDGKISLPLIGDVHAVGLTAEELSASVSKEISAYYKESPVVSTIVKAVNSSFVFVLGEVIKQGQIPVESGTTLLQAIALAGGFSEFASRSEILIRRKGKNGDEVTIRVRYKDILSGKEANIQLKLGDTIIVP